MVVVVDQRSICYRVGHWHVKKTNKTHQLLETIEYEHHKCAEKNMLKDEQIMNKLYAEYKEIMHWSKIEYSDRI